MERGKDYNKTSIPEKRELPYRLMSEQETVPEEGIEIAPIGPPAVSRRAAGIRASPTLQATNRARALRAAGHDILSLSAGEPDFDTPEHIGQAAVRALKQGLTRYTPVDGLPELKQAIVEKFRRENGLEYVPERILVSCGCKHSLYNLMQAVLNPGDEALIPAPYWTSYPDMVVLAGGIPLPLYAGFEQRFKIDAGQLQRAITERTRLLILNSPNNPTGACYRREELAEIAEVLTAHPQILVVSDDIYEHIFWQDEGFGNLANVEPRLADRIVICNGVSKAYAMTGWRIGYAAGPPEIVAAMKKIQSQSTSNPTSIAQAAACAALTENQDAVREYCNAFRERHAYVYERLDAMPHLRCLPAEGAFYLFPDCREAIARHAQCSDDLQFAERLLEEAGLSTVAGSAFGAPGHLRLSFAADRKTLEQAMDRLERFLKAL